MINHEAGKSTSIFFLIFTILFSSITVAQDFRWARQIKGITYDYADFANEMELDKDGNIYVFGETSSFLFDIDPTISGVEIINNSHIQNFGGLYLIKLDKNGNYLWGKTFGNYKRGSDYTQGLKIDKDGNLNLFTTISELNKDENIVNSFITITKLKPNGDLISTLKIPQSYGYGNSLNPSSFDLDSQNNIFITGYLIGSINLDANIPDLNLTATGIDNFILKIKNNGNYEWIKTFDNNAGSIAFSKVIIGKDDNINLLNGENLYKINSSDKSIIWEKKFINQDATLFHISDDNIILVNNKFDIYSTVDVDPSPNTVNVSADSYIIFLNLEGDFVDVKEFQRPLGGNVRFTAVTSDNKNNYYFGGTFMKTIDIDPSSSVFNMTASGYNENEAFYLKLDKNRNFVSAIKFGDETPKLSPYNNCEFLEIKKIKILNENSYLIGDFMWTCDFDPSITKQYTFETINSSTINRDGFVLKLGSCDVLKPIGDANQYFCSANSTIAELTPNSNDIKWYNTSNSTTPLLKTTLLVDGNTYYATQQNDNCPESIERLAVTAHVNQIPNTPIVTNSNFCKREIPKLSDISISGQNIKWYDTNITAAALPDTTLLENNRTYYASQTVGCESERTAILVKVYDTPLPTGNSNKQFCTDEIPTIENLTVTGTSLKWYDSASGGNILSETTLLQNDIYYVSQTLNNCESERLAINVVIQDTPIPIADSPQTFCTQENAKISNITISGQDIKWFGSISTTVPLSESTLLENGITYYVSQTINNCEGDRIPISINILGPTAAECINFVEEIPYPKFFTPNNDTHNDTWTIDYAYLKPNTGIRIFDRYGKFLKELRPNSEWDGTYNGQDMPASDYWFSVTRLNGTEVRGHFSLKR